MTPDEKRIVEWLREQSRDWDKLVSGWNKAGNQGPYLGAPSGSNYADAIDRGDHRK